MNLSRGLGDAAVTLFAPAKLTWYLEVVGRRDDGYHELRSEMLSVSLGDEVAIDGTQDGPVEITDEFGGALAAVNRDDNLVTRALEVVGRRAAVHVRKRIPVGGGLGGGSTDAGAILWWASFDDPVAAAELGGDVPFCVRGGRALVQGLGEQVTDLDFLERTVTLFLPPFPVSTAACYEAFDEIARSGQRAEGRNELTEAAWKVEPRLATAMSWISAELSCDVALCGSGSTFFAEGTVSGLDAVLATPVGAIRTIQVSSVPARDAVS